ncbi:hypothetical protein MLP_52240 [Microlunatus phosphovorus NM-1]|uniref:Plastocyanin-like domain-containing protein n=1 Tax=Microlunatus phosphovorus (strain ATCC 700054 / DSM 10555 / JCM 9379 / NBRC 101784 / NCIMB 13414 / VKM Ac-1990 / NM-1) TaxID=1032480 RepID=F5XIK0_MICPN|nr:hypothetical protein MLP_52240 [Microlunatus phosphovorus NM-1]
MTFADRLVDDAALHLVGPFGLIDADAAANFLPGGAGGRPPRRLVSDFHHPIHLHLRPFSKCFPAAPAVPVPAITAGRTRSIYDLPKRPRSLSARGLGGRVVFHCHNLEHEDMMGNFQTRPAG